MENIDWIWNSPKLHQLARANLKRFFAVIYELINKNKYDAIIVGGNTGLIMARYTRMLYSHLGMQGPPVIKTAPVRYKPHSEETQENLFDNTILDLDIRNQLIDYNISTISKVLFVDDEIYQGTTAKTCASCLAHALGNDRQLQMDIVAEDQGFVPVGFSENVKVSFTPFAKEVEGLNNIVMYVLPHETEKIFTKYLSREKVSSAHKIISLLLDLPLRDKSIPFSGFSYSLNDQAKNKVKEIETLKSTFIEFINKVMFEAIEDYRSGLPDLGDMDYVKPFLVND